MPSFFSPGKKILNPTQKFFKPNFSKLLAGEDLSYQSQFFLFVFKTIIQAFKRQK